MKYSPFSAYNAEKYQSLYNLARKVGALSIAGFYITLILAGIIFFTTENNTTINHQLNQILTVGLSISASAFLLSGMTVFGVKVVNKEQVVN